MCIRVVLLHLLISKRHEVILRSLELRETAAPHLQRLAAVTGQGFEITRIRANRSRPGLRPQHVAAVRAMAMVCNARVGGVFDGSPDLRYEPGPVNPGDFRFQLTGYIQGDQVTLTNLGMSVDAPLSGISSVGSSLMIGQVFRKSSARLFPTNKNPSLQSES